MDTIRGLRCRKDFHTFKQSCSKWTPSCMSEQEHILYRSSGSIEELVEKGLTKLNA